MQNTQKTPNKAFLKLENKHFANDTQAMRNFTFSLWFLI